MRFLKHYQGLILIIFLGLFLRLLFFREITFGYDMARDALESISIWTTDHLKLLGPGTDIPGVEHGVLYWYLISPLYFFSQGNVYLVKLALVFFSLANIILIYYFSQTLFKNRTTALFSAFLFTISFETISYARWVIHASQAVFFIGATYLGIWLLLKKKGVGLPIALISSVIALQFQFFNLYLLGFVFITIGYSVIKLKTQFTKRDLLLSSLSLVLLLPFVLKEIKYHFRIVSGLLNYFGGQAGISLIEKFVNLPEKFFNKISEVFYFNLFGFDQTFAKILTAIFLFWIIFSIYKNKQFRTEKIFLLFWLLSLNIIYLFEGFNAYFINMGMVFPLLLLFSFSLFGKPKIVFILLGILIFIGNFSLILKHNPEGEYLFSIQKRNILSDKYALVDYIYQDAKDRPFKINTVTEPLFINSVWAFVFNYYGKNKYGYMPQWAGYPQDGERVYGKEIPFAGYDENTKLLYLIVEPPEGLPKEYLTAYQKFENTRSKIIDEKNFGTHFVQKRELFNNKIFLRDEVFQYSLEK